METELISCMDVPLKVAGNEEDCEFLFRHFFRMRGPKLMAADRRWLPPTDLFETQDALVLVMDIAGIDPNDVSVKIEGHTLTIQGIRREFEKYPKRNYYLMEIDFGPFERRFHLPWLVDEERIEAHYSEGFLEVVMPKQTSVSSTGSVHITPEEDDNG
ncbi:Hsp20/alpha crystallin family protein [bacterium]|nr:Hsp20/alpha crystallin family protein [bacterium]